MCRTGDLLIFKVVLTPSLSQNLQIHPFLEKRCETLGTKDVHFACEAFRKSNKILRLKDAKTKFNEMKNFLFVTILPTSFCWCISLGLWFLCDYQTTKMIKILQVNDRGTDKTKRRNKFYFFCSNVRFYFSECSSMNVKLSV